MFFSVDSREAQNNRINRAGKGLLEPVVQAELEMCRNSVTKKRFAGGSRPVGGNLASLK
jgi:hypothetical protein